ncbi:MAG: ribosome maturation factor RimP [Desulfobulbaceae bacterium]|nr:ribosome maturation factor RimP [Desulfobulbaceae bacterium]
METATTARVRQLVEPVLIELGYELVELQLRNEPLGLVLRLIIYKDGGISLDDCSEVSRSISPLLEVEEPITRAYHLEVSSPGLDRPLRTERDFARNMGKKIEAVYRVEEVTRNVVGTIAGVNEIMVTITVDGAPEQIALADIVKAKLVIEFGSGKALV